MRPSGVSFAFQLVNIDSSSRGSWPALGQAHGLGRVRGDAVLVPGDVPGDAEDDLAVRPESGTIDAFGAPRLLAIPAIVRRKALSLKRSAASTIASSGSGQPAQDRLVHDRLDRGLRDSPSSVATRPRRLRRRSLTTGVVGLPSFTQPCSSAMSWQSGQTSTKFSPSAEYRTERSPTKQAPLADRHRCARR